MPLAHLYYQQDGDTYGVWTSISDIDLDDSFSGNSVSRKYFLDFVERVLLLHDASDIRRFRLAFDVPVRASRVNSWVKHNLQELDLSLPVRTSFVLPCCLFTCESLVVLVIEMDCALKVPTSVCLPSLKRLQLFLRTFLDDNSTQRLFSSCPVLEQLALVDCGWQNTKRITISVSSLRSLTFRKLPLVYINEDLLDCEFRIYAPNLFAINLSSNLTVDCLLLSPSSLKNASIDLLNQRAGRHEVAIRAIRLLNCIQNVKSLRISGDALMSLECAENLPSRLPTFYNLTTLEVDSDTSNYRVGVLIDFLQNTPNLEFLDIEGPAPDGCIRQEELTLQVVPKCFESNLRTISYSYFDGKDGELYLLKILLERATILKTMMIYCFHEFSADKKKVEDVKNQLHTLARGSQSCVINIM